MSTNWILLLWAVSLQASAQGPAQTALQQAVRFEQESRFFEALAAYRTAVHHEPGHEAAVTGLSKLLFKMGLADPAAAVCTRLLDRRPRLFRVRLNLIYLLQWQGRFGEAGGHIEKVLEGSPHPDEQLYARHLLGRNQLGLQQEDGAEESFLEVLKIDPNFAESRLNLAEIYSRRPERRREAVPHFERVLELKPELADVHRQLGKVLLELGELETAARRLERALQIQPRDPETFFLLAAVYRRQGDRDATRDMMDRFQTLEAELRAEKDRDLEAESLLFEGRERMRAGENEAALEVLRKAVEIRPSAPEGHRELARAWLAAGRFQEAARSAEQALQLQPFSPQSHFVQAGALARSGDSKAALGAGGRALLLDPSAAEYHNLMGQLFFELEQYEKAAAAFHAAAGLEPDNPAYRRNLESALRQTGRSKEGNDQETGPELPSQTEP